MAPEFSKLPQPLDHDRPWMNPCRKNFALRRGDGTQLSKNVYITKFHMHTMFVSLHTLFH